MSDLPSLMTLAEAAQHLPWGKEALRRDCVSGKLSHVRRGTRYYVRPSDISEYVERMACPSGTPERASNGEATEESTKSYGTSAAGDGAVQQALTILDGLSKSSPHGRTSGSDKKPAPVIRPNFGSPT